MPKARKIRRRHPSRTPAPPAPAIAADRLLADIRALIEAAREQAARAVNSAQVLLYWSIGKRIREDVLHHKRAAYGEAIVATLSQQLTAEYGRGTVVMSALARRTYFSHGTFRSAGEGDG